MKTPTRCPMCDGKELVYSLTCKGCHASLYSRQHKVIIPVDALVKAHKEIRRLRKLARKYVLSFDGGECSPAQTRKLLEEIGDVEDTIR